MTASWPSLDGVRMRAVDAESEGLISSDTLFTFTESGGLVSARYAGGRITLGYLIGQRQSQRVDFHYVQADRSGRIDTGRSTCEMLVRASGRIRLVEHFTWESRDGRGTNVLEQVDAAG
jgi:hypothetical protein